MSFKNFIDQENCATFTQTKECKKAFSKIRSAKKIWEVEALVWIFSTSFAIIVEITDIKYRLNTCFKGLNNMAGAQKPLDNDKFV